MYRSLFAILAACALAPYLFAADPNPTTTQSIKLLTVGPNRVTIRRTETTAPPYDNRDLETIAYNFAVTIDPDTRQYINYPSVIEILRAFGGVPRLVSIEVLDERGSGVSMSTARRP
jgi:hypothetical protein